MASQAEIDLIVNASNTQAQLTRDLDRIVRAAEDGADDIDVNAALRTSASLAAVTADLNRLIATAQASADDIDVDVDIDTDRARGGLRRLIPDIDGATRSVGTLARGLVPAAAGIASMGLAAGGAVPLLAGLVTSIESVLPASAVATQGMLAMVLVSGTLKLGMQGVGDAVSTAFDPEASPEDLAKAMENLAPEAQKFVTALSGMREEFDALKLDVQDRLFRDLDGSVAKLSRSALPQVSAALGQTADALNDMAQGAVNAAADLAADGTLGKALDGAVKGIENLVDLPGQATTAFGQLAAAAAPAFDRITSAVGRVATSISEDLTQAFESGALEDAINGALDVIKQLGRIAGNVFGVLGNLIAGVNVEGNGLFSTLESLTQTLEDATGTPEFQSALSELSATMATLAENVAPLFTKALSILGEVITILAPYARELIEVLGTQLGGILEAAREPLGALAEAFGELVIALTPILELAGELIIALLPSLTPLFETLRDVIIELAPVVQQLAENFAAQLVPLLERLPEILEMILPLFTEVAEEVFPLLLDILEQLGPSLLSLSIALADLAVEIAPLIAGFLALTVAAGGELLELLGPVLVGLFEGLAGSMQFLADIISGVVIPILKTIKDLLNGDVRGALVNFGNASDNLKRIVGEAFNAMLARVSGLMQSFMETVALKSAQAGQRLIEGVRAGIERMVSEVARVPGRVLSALGNLGGLLVGAGRSLMQGFIDGIASSIGRIRDLLGSVTSMIPDWKGPAEVDAKLLTENGRLIMQSLIDGFEDTMPEVRATLGGVTSDIPSAVGVPRTSSMAPTVYVTIGNEAVDQYVTARVQAENADNTRTMAQGVRR